MRSRDPLVFYTNLVESYRNVPGSTHSSWQPILPQDRIPTLPPIIDYPLQSSGANTWYNTSSHELDLRHCDALRRAVAAGAGFSGGVWHRADRRRDLPVRCWLVTLGLHYRNSYRELRRPLQRLLHPDEGGAISRKRSATLIQPSYYAFTLLACISYTVQRAGISVIFAPNIQGAL